MLVRHLVMPALLEDTRAIVQFFAREISQDTYVNLMDQYYPAWKVVETDRFAEIARRVRRREMEQAYRYARAEGLWRFDTRFSEPERGWMSERF